MSIYFTLVSFIDLIGLIIGLSLGLGLIIYKWKQKASLFLALFILCYSFGILPSILIDFQIEDSFLTNLFIQLDWSWLLFPLFYIYIQYVSILKAKDIKTPVFLGFIGILGELILSSVVENVFFETLVFSFGLLFAVWYGFKIVLWIGIQQKKVNDQYSNVIEKELNWSKKYVIVGLIFTIVGYVLFLLKTGNPFVLDFMSVLNVLLLFAVSFKGIFQAQIQPIEKSIAESKGKQAKNQSPIHNQEIVRILEKYIQDSECYKHFDLTINDLSNATNIHPKKISESINTVLNSNFNSYINSFRIRKAKELLLQPSSFSIEGIGIDVGFQSKSTFFRAFKKETTVTPNTFRKNA